MKKLVLFFLAGAVCAACDWNATIDDPTLENEFVPIELSTETRSFVEDGNRFAIDLLQQIEQNEKASFMVSPLSVSLDFGMLVEAAEEGNPTMKEVCRVLGFGNGSREAIRTYCETMTRRLPLMDQLTKVGISNLVLANSMYGNTNAAFAHSVETRYGALVKNLSFADKSAVVQLVNDWAKEKTEGMIEKAITENDIMETTMAILSNALYFKGKWKEPFDKGMTVKDKFSREDGKTESMEMMNQSQTFAYSECPAGQILSLPYGNGAFSMNVFLPGGKNGVRDMIAWMAKAQSSDFNGQPAEVDVRLPKFNTKGRLDLKKVLIAMGMGDAFSSLWFSLYESGSPSLVSDTFQTTAIKVDEEGTEAAAVTVIVGDKGAGPSGHKRFFADHPFVYTITENSTGAVLFAGVFRGND